MPFLEDLINQSNMMISQQQVYSARDTGVRPGAAYASYYPNYEVQSPQYVTPNAHAMSQTGYRQNEFAYSIIGKRARAKAQASLRVKKEIGTKNDEDQPAHDLLKLLKKPNSAPNMTERMFWQMKQISQDIAGFSAWEIEYNLLGEPMSLWYMTPQFCSFMRGQQQPLRAIRYQPYGLQAVDIPIIDEEGKTKILFFSNGEDFDPLYPGVRFWSPMMAAFNEVQVDNAMTFFLNDFMRNGAKFAGLISVAQTIDQSQADDYKRRWRAQHGGAENWADPLILGEGATYTSMQMNFKDMAFPDLDARTESRICNAFSMDPIVAGAKAGLDISSYNNKEQAHKHWHYEWVIPSWKDDEDAMTNQILPVYGDDPDTFRCEFDLSDVYSLWEDRNAQAVRAVSIYEKRVAKLNEARQEMDLEPIDGPEGDAFYEAVRVAANQPVNAEGEAEDGTAAGALGPDGKPLMEADGKKPDKPKTQAEIDAADAEKKKFRAFAKRRIKEGKQADLPEYEFKYIDAKERHDLLVEFGVPMPEDADRVLKGLAIAVKAAAEIERL